MECGLTDHNSDRHQQNLRSDSPMQETPKFASKNAFSIYKQLPKTIQQYKLPSRDKTMHAFYFIKLPFYLKHLCLQATSIVITIVPNITRRNVTRPSG